MKSIVIGTAGHIDHGKSSLVRALTGTDPDRLPEEKRRQITIDLGYAFLSDGTAIIDVPGHEKFIRNMVAGAATIDYAILAVAADDGVMPQTREHLQILNFLGIRHGCVVITKCSLVESDQLNLVEHQIREEIESTFLNNAPLFQVDSLSGHGISEFKSFLLETVSQISRRPDYGVFRLPIDRVFSMKGHGSVVTGTVLSGSAKIGDHVSLLPIGINIRIKRIESQGTERESATAGRRAALNIAGDLEQLDRGQTLATTNSLLASNRIQVALELINSAQEIRDRQRIRILIGTQECIGRIRIMHRAGEKLYADILLETPVVAAWNDRFILRRYSPVETLGGGRVLLPDTSASKRHPPKELISSCLAVDTESLPEAMMAYMESLNGTFCSLAVLSAMFGASPDTLKEVTANSKGRTLLISDFVVSNSSIQRIQNTFLQNLKALQQSKPALLGFPITDLLSGEIHSIPEPLAIALLLRMEQEGSVRKSGSLYTTSDFSAALSDHQQKLVTRLVSLLRADSFTPRSVALLSESTGLKTIEIDRLLALAERFGLCKRLGADLFFESSAFEKAVQIVKSLVASKKELSVSEVSTALNSSRKYVVPFLEYLDQQGITARNGNFRVAGRALLNSLEQNPS